MFVILCLYQASTIIQSRVTAIWHLLVCPGHQAHLCQLPLQDPALCLVHIDLKDEVNQCMLEIQCCLVRYNIVSSMPCMGIFTTAFQVQVQRAQNGYQSSPQPAAGAAQPATLETPSASPDRL